VTIRTDVPLDIDWHRLRRTEPDIPRIEAIFDELDFGTRLRDRVRTTPSGGPEAAGALLPWTTPSSDFGDQQELERST
jgi:hypothetical protein